MKYICNVNHIKDRHEVINHVVEISTGNVEVTEGKHAYSGDKPIFMFNGIKIDVETLSVTASDKSLSQIVLACELVKFIIEKTR